MKSSGRPRHLDHRTKYQRGERCPERELWKSAELPLRIQLSTDQLIHVMKLPEAGKDPLERIRKKWLELTHDLFSPA